MKCSVFLAKSFHALGWNCCNGARVSWKLKFALLKIFLCSFPDIGGIMVNLEYSTTWFSLILFGGTGSYYSVCPWYKIFLLYTCF